MLLSGIMVNGTSSTVDVSRIKKISRNRGDNNETLSFSLTFDGYHQDKGTDERGKTAGSAGNTATVSKEDGERIQAAYDKLHGIEEKKAPANE